MDKIKKKIRRRKVHKIENNLEKFKNDYNFIEKYIETIIDDHQLMKDGWQFNFAIDYYDIWKFASSQNVNIDDSISGEYQALLARIFLFYGLKFVPPVVLLPGYALELQNQLEIIASEAMEEKDRLPEAYKVEKIKNIITKKELELLESVNKYYKKKKRIPSELIPPTIKILKTRFSKLFSMVIQYPETISLINQLFKDRRVIKYTKAWKQHAELFNVKYENELLYEPLFNVVHEYRRLPNIRDAMALEQLSELNKSANDKNLYFLISGSDKMRKAFDDTYQYVEKEEAYRIRGKSTPRLEIEHELLDSPDPISLYRDLELFQTYILFQTNTRDETLNQLMEFSKENINTYYEVRGALAKLKWICSMVDYCKDCDSKSKKLCIKALIDSKSLNINHQKLIELWRARKRRKFILPYKNLFLTFEEERIGKGEEAISLLITFISRKDKRVQNKIVEAIEYIEDTIRKTTLEILDDTEGLVIHFGENLKKLSNKPYSYLFKSKEIIHSIDVILKDRSSAEDIEESIDIILYRIMDTEFGEDLDSDILKVVFLLVQDSFITAWRSVKTIEENGPYEDSRSLDLLKLYIFTQMASSHISYPDPRSLIEEIRNCFETNSSEMQFYSPYGAGLYSLYKVTNNREYLNEAIDITKKGLNIICKRDKLFEIALLNNLIFFLQDKCKGKLNKFQEIKPYSQRLLELSKIYKHKLRPNQEHTLGLYYFEYGKALYGKKSKEWPSKIKIGERFLYSAYKNRHNKVFPDAKKKIEKSYENVNKFINKLSKENYKIYSKTH